MDDNPLTLGILEKGEFTKKINSLKEGDEFYVRGPYGQGWNVPYDSKVENSRVFLVGGGCGIAGIYLFAKYLSKKTNLTTLLAAKDKAHLPYLKKFSDIGQLYISTEDGSLGKKGMITDLFKDYKTPIDYFFNCGPKAMIDAVLPLELKYCKPEKIYSSVDYMTRCGVGICGSCADKKGRRTCVEGPFMNNTI
jgi:dihydroorotate dehydrogenase (NAD+) catalytic subunit